MSARWSGRSAAPRRMPGELLLTGLAAIAAAFASILHLYPAGAFPSYDSSAYIFIADSMLAGRIPYLQLWENKGLPLYAIDMLGRLLTPGRYTGIWWLELIFLTLAYWGVIRTLRRFASVPATSLAVVMLVLGIVMSVVGGNITELWNLPVQACGLAVAWALVGGAQKRDRWLFVLAGVAAGFAGMMKVSLLGTWVAVFALVVALTAARKLRVNEALRVLGLMAAGFAAVAVVSIAPIVFWSATAAWWDQWIVFGVNMTRHGFGGERLTALQAGREGLARIAFVTATLLVALIAAPVGWLLGGRARVDSKRAWIGGFLGGWLAVELWASTANGLAYTHYALPWLIPAAALTALLLGGVKTRWPAYALAVAGLLAGVWLAAPEFAERLDLQRAFPPVVRHEDTERRAAQDRMIREVKQRTKPSETVLVWGMDPVVYAETGRLSAGPYGHPLDVLMAPGYQSEARFSAFVRALEKNPPKLIIDSSYLRPDRPAIEDLRVIQPTKTSYGLIQPYMRTLADFVDARYRRVATGSPRVEYYELVGE